MKPIVEVSSLGQFSIVFEYHELLSALGKENAKRKQRLVCHVWCRAVCVFHVAWAMTTDFC